ncbi:MAG TPA: hypothetical protein ENI64_08240 [Gammaproteobacteria bacterium]|nr:hypothetical protein [Gammaproteobacteria bacterium]
MLKVAAILIFLLGAVHSILGERYILIRLFRRENIPRLFGSDSFTKGTLRFAWHVTTFAWWGFAYLLWQISAGEEGISQTVLYTIVAVSFISGVFAFYFTRGKHLSWVIFIIIAGLAYCTAQNS